MILLRLGLLSGFPPLLLEGGLRSALVLPPLWAIVVLPSFSLTIVISLKERRQLALLKRLKLKILKNNDLCFWREYQNKRARALKTCGDKGYEK